MYVPNASPYVTLCRLSPGPGHPAAWLGAVAELARTLRSPPEATRLSWIETIVKEWGTPQRPCAGVATADGRPRLGSWVSEPTVKKGEVNGFGRVQL